MPTYIYGCSKEKDHPRAEVVHGMLDNPIMECQVCHAPMRRIPTRFQWGVDSLWYIVETSERNISRKRRGEARDYRYDSIKLDRGIPGRDYKYRK